MPPETLATSRLTQPGEVRSSGRLHRATTTLCVVAIAAAATGLCGADGFAAGDWAWLLGSIAVTMLASVAGRAAIDRDRAGWLAATGPLVVVIYLGNGLLEPLVRLLGGGRPLEVVLQSGLAALLPVLAFGSALRRWVPIAGGVSLAVTLFSVCLLSGPAVTLLAAVWAALVPVWLTILTDESTAADRIVDRGRSAQRLLAAAGIGGLMLTASLAAMLGGRDSLSLSKGFLASSGGDGSESEYARDGVGDGRHLVPATTMAESFGPIDDAPFAKSDEASLYDVFDERYDAAEVVKISKNDRAVALDPEDVQDREREMAEAEAAGRAFSTLRSPRDDERGQVGDRPSDALFYVAGRVPLHLRTAVFEDFDGAVWRSGEFVGRDLATPVMTEVDGQPWLILVDDDRPGYRELRPVMSDAEAHAIKPVQIADPLIPLPPCATAIHIRDVAVESMFRALPGGLVRMDRRRLPKLVPIHIASRRIDRDKLADDTRFYSGPHELHSLPADDATKRIRQLAASWVDGLPRGWLQIAEIERRLRDHAVVDESAALSDAPVPVAEFLLNDVADDGSPRRGPDYLFATAATVMLRSQGYAARLVQGFYADPDDYDADAGHTPIHASDLHTWCEVRIAGGAWVTVEPTPGYDVLQPPRSLWYRVLRAIRSLPAAAWRHRLAIAAAALLLPLLVAARFWLLDRLWSWWLRLSGRDRDAGAVWPLVAWRMRRIRPRPPGWTVRRQIDSLGLPVQTTRRLQSLAGAAERSAFAPPGAGAASGAGASPVDVEAAAVLRTVTLAALKAADRFRDASGRSVATEAGLGKTRSRPGSQTGTLTGPKTGSKTGSEAVPSLPDRTQETAL